MNDETGRAERRHPVDPRADEFLPRLLHTVRNAMQPVQSSLSFVRLEAASQPRLLELVDGAERAQRQVSAVLGAAQRLLAPLELQPEPADLAGLVERAAAELGDAVAVQLEGAGPTCTLDPALMHDALAAALGALAHSVAGPVTVRGSLEHGGADGVLRLERVAGEPSSDPVSLHLSELELAVARRIVCAHRGELASEAPGSITIRLPAPGA